MMTEFVEKKTKLSQWWKVTLEEELEKNPKLKLESIREMREWLESQSHLPSEIDDLSLVMFIHGADYDLDYAKYLLSNNYHWRTHKNMFQNRDPQSEELKYSIQNVAKIGWTTESKTGDVIAFGSVKECDNSQFDVVKFGTVVPMVLELLQLHKGTVSGIKYVQNTNDFTFLQITKCLFALTGTLIPYIQEYHTQTCNEIHVINSSYFLEKISAAVRPLLSERMKNRIFFHRTTTTLANHFEPECLIEEYGGTAPSLSTLAEKTSKTLMEHREYFLEEAKLRIDKTKEPQKPGLFSYFSRS